MTDTRKPADDLREYASANSDRNGSTTPEAQMAIRAADLLDEAERALAFYASHADYAAPFTGGMGKLWQDCGETARATLDKLRGQA